MATSSEAVRRLAYRVDSDDAVRRIGGVQSAQKGVTAALEEGSRASEANEARTAKLQAKYEMLTRQQRAYQAVLISQAAASMNSTAANDNQARSTSHLSDVLRIATKTAVDHAASWLATAGAVGASVLIFGGLLAILGPIILAYKAVKVAVGIVSDAWELSGKKLEEHRQIAAKAAAVDLATDYFQRITKAATDAKLPVDDLTAAFKKLNSESTEKLGGSSLQTKLDALREAGNFKGNTGVDQLAAANTTEQKFRAIVSLVDQAMQKGERLAALDLAGTVLGPAIAENLRKDSEYLNRMQESADKLAATEIVSAGDVGRAIELQARYDAAVKILETRWHPIQDLLTSAGIRMREAWVGIVEAVATAVDWVTKLVMKIGEIPQTFWSYIAKGATVAFGAVPVVGPALSIGARVAGNAMADPPVAAATAYGEAVNKLRAGLQNTHAVQQQVNEAMTVANKVYGDTSKAAGEKAAPAVMAHRDALTRAIDGVEKYILVTDAAAKSVDAGIAEQTKAKVIADLTAAAQRDGKTNLEQYAASWDELGTRAGKAAQELAKARVASDIKFRSDTVGLSSEDVQIAAQLRNIYLDVAEALNSVEAAKIRVANAQQLLADGFREVGKSMLTAFLSGKNVMDAMVQSLDNLANKLANAAFDNILTGLMTGNFVQAGIGALQAGASALISMFTGDQKAQKALDEAKAKWAAMSDQVTAFNRAAAGFDLGPLTNELNSLLNSLGSLVNAAREANDEAGARRLEQAFNSAAVRITAEFTSGAQNLTPLQEAMKSLSDEAAGLYETLMGLNFGSLAEQIGPALQRQIDALKAQFTDSMTDTLYRSINNSRGEGYINDLADAVGTLYANLAQASQLGSTRLADLSNQDYILKVQAIVDGAELTGQAFNDFIARVPEFASSIHAFVEVIDEAANAAANAATKLDLQFRILTATTDSSTLQGQLTLFDAKAQREKDAAVAAAYTVENLDLLTQALAAERNQIIKNVEATEAAAAASAAAAAAQEAAAKAATNATEKLNLQMRLLTATTDSSTLLGALSIFDAKAQQERDAAAAAGSTNLLLLDQVLTAERENLVKDFAQKAIDAEKQVADARLAQMQRIQQYLDNLKGGSNSFLSPGDQLSAARSQFGTQLSAAQGGDANALSNITSYADNLLSASREFNASSQAFQNDFAYVTTALAALAASGAVAGMPSASSIGGVTSISTASAPANSNANLSAVFASLNSQVGALTAEVVLLKTTLKASIDAGNASNAEGQVQENEKLERIASNTSRIPASANQALAAPG